MTTSTMWSEMVEEEVEEETELTTSGDKSIKIVTEYRTNEKGQRVKVTKKIKIFKNIRKINKRAEERRQRWHKFGKAGVEGADVGVTSLCEEVPLVLGDKERKMIQTLQEEKQDEEELKRMYASLMANPKSTGSTPATAGGPPASVIWKPKFDRSQGPKPGGPPGSGNSLRPPPKEGTYVSPRLRALNGNLPPSEDDATIRVTNLSEDINEEDLKGLFRPFGDISRVFLAKDKMTLKSKGFAFINFKSKQSAQTAMDSLNGKGWEYLILSIEWAKPSVH